MYSSILMRESNVERSVLKASAKYKSNELRFMKISIYFATLFQPRSTFDWSWLLKHISTYNIHSHISTKAYNAEHLEIKTDLIALIYLEIYNIYAFSIDSIRLIHLTPKILTRKGTFQGNILICKSL